MRDFWACLPAMTRTVATNSPLVRLIAKPRGVLGSLSAIYSAERRNR
jgi:hypothetical protein